MPKYKGDAYLRLSYSADRSVESDSIANQKKLIEDFVAAHPDIELVSERVDDGYSGVLFDRPAFQEMMNDIVSGKINCVIVKDLSRLGREYIETGRYLRQIFPTYGVRFISVNDGIDTANEQNGDDLHISLKNLLNDTYCRDISVKTRSALLTKRQNGDYVGSCPIYGYQKDPENKNHLVIDEYPARVVRDIYRRRIDGASAKQRLRYVILPMLMPTISTCTFLTLTNGFKLFDQNLALTGGNPGKMSQLLALNIYDTMYGTTGWQGVGQAKAVIFFILVAVIAVLQNRLTTSKEVQS